MECVMGSNPAWTSEGLTALLDIFQVLTSKDFSSEETERRTMGVKLQNIEAAKANLFNVICDKQWKTNTLYPYNFLLKSLLMTLNIFIELSWHVHNAVMEKQRAFP